RGALSVGGPTVAVMAGGLDGWYPRGNSRLLDQIAGECVVVTEIPPGIRPTRQGFLARNRLIAALSGGTLVVEAAARSGALNTASWSLRLGRPLMAVPGPINSALSESPHRLIRDHEAALVADANDAGALLTPVGEHVELPGVKAVRELDGLDPELAAVREAMPSRGDIDLDSLSVASGRSAAQCAAALIRLDMRGLVQQTGPQHWRIRRPRHPAGAPAGG
ncbi:DNA processing protein DprA, partial [Propionibacterium freudenreichii]|nr:DNA processing protein DprA [Propionibacterium freudenreichii]